MWPIAMREAGDQITRVMKFFEVEQADRSATSDRQTFKRRPAQSVVFGRQVKGTDHPGGRIGVEEFDRDGFENRQAAISSSS